MLTKSQHPTSSRTFQENPESVPKNGRVDFEHQYIKSYRITYRALPTLVVAQVVRKPAEPRTAQPEAVRGR